MQKAQHTNQRRIGTSKTAKIKMIQVIKVLHQSTFRRYTAKVLSPFLIFAVFRCQYAVNWCDNLTFLHLLLL